MAPAKPHEDEWSAAMTKPCVVLDTNVLLDLWLYDDPAIPALRDAIHAGELHWVTTAVMREELARVLAYPHIAQRLERDAKTAEDVLREFDRLAQWQAVADKAPYTCKDPDDQKFIDLAVAHGATLVSKDKAVLTMRNRLARVGVSVMKAWTPNPQTLRAD